MCKECEANNKQLTPEELETVSGGDETGVGCWFAISNTNQYLDKDNNYRRRCKNAHTRNCHPNNCKCYGTNECVEGDHIVTRSGWAHGNQGL